jgi:hypothetical protein
MFSRRFNTDPPNIGCNWPKQLYFLTYAHYDATQYHLLSFYAPAFLRMRSEKIHGR